MGTPQNQTWKKRLPCHPSVLKYSRPTVKKRSQIIKLGHRPMNFLVNVKHIKPSQTWNLIRQKHIWHSKFTNSNRQENTRKHISSLLQHPLDNSEELLVHNFPVPLLFLLVSLNFGASWVRSSRTWDMVPLSVSINSYGLVVLLVA